MYQRFLDLLKENDISAYKVGKDNNISQTTLSSWKKGISQPKVDKLQKIADYFGVSLEWLLGKTDDRHGTDPNKAVSPLIKENYTAHEKNLIDMYRELPADFKQLIDSNIKAYYKMTVQSKLDEKKAI